MNKTQLQTNNTKFASLIQTLQGKTAGGGSEENFETCNVSIVFTGFSNQLATKKIGFSFINEDNLFDMTLGSIKSGFIRTLKCGTVLTLSDISAGITEQPVYVSVNGSEKQRFYIDESGAVIVPVDDFDMTVGGLNHGSFWSFQLPSTSCDITIEFVKLS